ncbi:MAG: hydrogenase, partial [Desulfobulbaceae bacterium]|nr:hydrogenase [Desulfobulbaceae bacterium]
MGNLLKIANGETVKRSDIPHLPFHVFRQELSGFALDGGQIVHYFAYEDNGVLKVLAVLRNDGGLYVTGSDVAEAYHSLTIDCEKFHMFEREIAEQYGVRPYEHPWLKHVRYHANLRQREDIFGNDYTQDIPGNYDYFPVEGEAIHEVAVGPVHAGIIEPGHFRFQCIGEEVLHLE